jgi:hypothetical protein
VGVGRRVCAGCQAVDVGQRAQRLTWILTLCLEDGVDDDGLLGLTG